MSRNDRLVIGGVAKSYGTVASLQTYRPAKQQQRYLSIEVLDMHKLGVIIEHCARLGITGSKVEDTGLATYIYWEHLPCES